MNQQTVVTALPRRDNPDTARKIEDPLPARCIRSAENRGVVQP
nr:L809 [uncultured bacterium]